MKHINSIRHNRDTRAHIPSKEEAGYEEANEKVQSGKKVLEIPSKSKGTLSEASKQTIKKNVEKTLKIEIDEEAFDRLYGHISHPIEIKHKGQKIAVRMISQFGEESTKVIIV